MFTGIRHAIRPQPSLHRTAHPTPKHNHLAGIDTRKRIYGITKRTNRSFRRYSDRIRRTAPRNRRRATHARHFERNQSIVSVSSKSQQKHQNNNNSNNNNTDKRAFPLSRTWHFPVRHACRRHREWQPAETLQTPSFTKRAPEQLTHPIPPRHTLPNGKRVIDRERERETICNIERTI